MKDGVILGVDLGTSYFKLALFDHQGELVGLATVGVDKDMGDGSRCEVASEQFWSWLKTGVLEACRQAHITSEHIRAISYASQANSFVLLDRHHEPLTPLILWCDNRALNMEHVHDLFDKQDFLQRTGLGLASDHQFCVAKIAWLQNHEPELWQQTASLLTISDYLTFGLTNEMVGDAGTASLLGLLNLHTLEWQKDIIDLGGVQLAVPLWPGTVAGGVTAHGAERLGVPQNIPVVLGSLDHHMAAIGAGVGHVAEMSESTGTVLACVQLRSDFSPAENICTGAGLHKGQFYQLAFDGNGAAAWEWYHRQYARQFTMLELERLAAGVAIGSDGVTARPNAQHYPGLEGFQSTAPAHHEGHYSRAIMESTAASLKPLVEHLGRGRLPAAIVATGGGAQNDQWLQIKADLLGVEYIRTTTSVPTCKGAATLAAVALGWFTDLDAVSRRWIKIQKRFTVSAENHARYEHWYRRCTS
jgi:xylulokinase